MKERPTRRVWIRLAVGLVGFALALACAPKAARRQTDVMEESGKVKVSAAELRAVVNDLADRLTGRIEQAADRIGAATEDPAVRRRALALKIDGIPTVWAAAYRADPLGALVDVWALAFQAVHYVEEGAGRDAYGPRQDLAREAARGLLADADEAVRPIVARPAEFGLYRERVESWAKQHPVEHTFSFRPTAASFAADLRAEGRDAFVAVGAITDTLENLSERLNRYAAHLPRQARWEAELMLLDLKEEREVKAVLGDLHAVGGTAERMNDLLGEGTGLLGTGEASVRGLVAAERRAVLAGVDAQRVATLEYLTAERKAVLEAVREERIALLSALRQERLEGLQEVDAIKTRGVDSSVEGLKDVVDHALWRTAAILLVLMVSAATLGVIGYWLTIGRRGRAALS